MKKMLLTTLLLVSLITTALASGTKNVDIRVLRSFDASYRDAKNVSWSLKQSFVQVDFELNGKKLSAYYQPDGELIATSEKISLDDLPVNAKRKFAKKYGSYTVKEALKFVTADEVAYFISAANETGTEIVKVNVAGFLSSYKKM